MAVNDLRIETKNGALKTKNMPGPSFCGEFGKKRGDWGNLCINARYRGWIASTCKTRPKDLRKERPQNKRRWAFSMKSAMKEECRIRGCDWLMLTARTFQSRKLLLIGRGVVCSRALASRSCFIAHHSKSNHVRWRQKKRIKAAVLHHLR
jgi:hypothetical protein